MLLALKEVQLGAGEKPIGSMECRGHQLQKHMHLCPTSARSRAAEVLSVNNYMWCKVHKCMQLNSCAMHCRSCKP